MNSDRTPSPLLCFPVKTDIFYYIISSCIHIQYSGYDSHFEVCSSLKLLDDNLIRSVGGALGLAFNVLQKMKSLPEDMVAAWLRKEEYVSEDPTWRTLIKALRRVGQTGIADTIENDRR